jgi:hypothetical protein
MTALDPKASVLSSTTLTTASSESRRTKHTKDTRDWIDAAHGPLTIFLVLGTNRFKLDSRDLDYEAVSLKVNSTAVHDQRE